MSDEVKRVEGWERSSDSDGHWYSPHTAAAGISDKGLWVHTANALFRSAVPLPVLRALLLSQGLHIVGEAEMRVLEAMGEAELSHDGYHFAEENGEIAAVQAELARRAAKGE